MAEYFYPCTPWKNFNTLTGKFLDESYYRATGSDHTGQDINGNGGGNTDLGALVRCITDGTVVEAKWFPVWGNIVLVYHPGPAVWSMYAHLNVMTVSKGQTIKAGTQVGTIGRGANNVYLAHLHFEIRTANLPANTWPSSMFKKRVDARNFIAANYVEPMAFLAKNNARP